MKRCPACNRTYANDAQKFCTQDGIALVDAHSAGAGQGETVRIDSAQLDDKVMKVIPKELPRMTGSGFDPYRTVMASPPETSATPSPKIEDVAPPAEATSTPQPPVAPAPPSANVPSNQVAAAPMAPQPAAPAAASVASSSRPPKKRSKLPLILGILVVLLMLGAGAAVAGYFFVLKPMLAAKRGAMVEPRRPEPTPVVMPTPNVGKTKPEIPKVEVPPYSPPADAV
ncbi:MAG: hypothetical protein DMF73_04295, partial [Acidobacteria bacterium]